MFSIKMSQFLYLTVISTKSVDLDQGKISVQENLQKM